MKHLTNPWLVTNGSFRQGTMKVSFRSLVNTFGLGFWDRTNRQVDYKSDIEWRIIYPKVPEAVTIYNYKSGKSYLGSVGDPVREIINWHIGGRSKAAYSLIRETLTIEPYHKFSNPDDVLPKHYSPEFMIELFGEGWTNTLDASDPFLVEEARLVLDAKLRGLDEWEKIYDREGFWTGIVDLYELTCYIAGVGDPRENWVFLFEEPIWSEVKRLKEKAEEFSEAI